MATMRQTARELPSCGVPQPWSARFRCVMAVAAAGQTAAVFDGRIEGHVVAAEQGAGGFGYDALFIPEGHTQTFAELPSEVKNALSHRARALAGVVAFFSK
jgi:XTP/dITP diphosphohydrolase